MPSNSSTSWVPNEPSQTLFSERCWLQGAFISAIAYGIDVCLYFLSLYLLVRGKNRIEFKRRLPLLIYITVTFILGTLFMIALAGFTQMSFIDDRNFPGGPNAFENNMFSIRINFMAANTFVLSNWLSDGLVVWRFKVIFQKCRAPLWIVMLFPCLLLAGSVAMGAMTLVQSSSTSPYLARGVDYMLPYYSTSLALNIILTVAIVIRLLVFRYQAVAALGPTHGKQYTSVAAIIIESATLYSAFSVTVLALFGIKNAVSQVFLQSLGQIQTMTTLLIVFRIAQGKGWTDETATHVTSTFTRGSDPVELNKMRITMSTLTGHAEVMKIAGEEFRP